MKTRIVLALWVGGIVGVQQGWAVEPELAPLPQPIASILQRDAIYRVLDPFAPNWDIEEERLSDDTYRLSLKMRRFHTGGAGESMQALKRRAAQLQREYGFNEYQILEYSEGIESGLISAQRVADGVIRLVHRAQADSF